jgi:hypothetical protein
VLIHGGVRLPGSPLQKDPNTKTTVFNLGTPFLKIFGLVFNPKVQRGSDPADISEKEVVMVTILVPKGFRVIIKQSSDGSVTIILEPI